MSKLCVFSVHHCLFSDFTCHVNKIDLECLVAFAIFCSRRIYERKIIQYTNRWSSLASFLTEEFWLNLLLRWYGILISLLHVLLFYCFIIVRTDYLDLPTADWWGTHFFSWNWNSEMSRGKWPSWVNYVVNLGFLFISRYVTSQVSITLETSETISPHVIHPSRRVSPTITKVYFLR